MSNNDLRQRVLGYEDDDLIQRAWDEFLGFEASAEVKAEVRRDIEEAEEQLLNFSVLSGEGRGRLRQFLFNKLCQDRRLGR